MDAVLRVLYSLRFCHNSLAPVNRLPSEILTRVFSLLQMLDPIRSLDYSKPATGYNIDIGWLRATHVCCQWRIAAVGDPCLWSNIHVSSGARWTDAFLHRAQMAPIMFNAAHLVKPTRSIDVASAVVSHLCHMRELRISAIISGELASILPLLRTAAPVLEKALVCNTDWFPNQAGLYTESPALPANLFDRTAPRLQELKVSDCGFFWSSISFASLVNLDVEFLSKTNIQNTSNSEFNDFNACLCALAGMPMLESLRLDCALPKLPLGAAFDTLPAVTLPNVGKFILVDDVLECAVTLQHISTPVLKGEDMHICCTVNTAAGRGANLMHPWIASRLCAASPICSGATSIRCWDDGFGLSVSDHCTHSPALQRIGSDADSTDSESGPGHAPAMGTPFLQISFEGSETFTEIRGVLQLLPLGYLEVFQVSGEDSFRMGYQHLFTAFRGCETVRHVRLAGGFARDFIRLGTFGFLFPATDSVTFEDVDFTVGKLSTGIHIACSSRRVQQIHLLDCRTDEQMRNRMARRVPEVFWDGVSDSGHWGSKDDDNEDDEDDEDGEDGEDEEEDDDEVDDDDGDDDEDDDEDD
ncbi:hypothetical protein EVG20_g3357 [Dentipellis fragilis]|uniref:F-box domain-containing protein n=1 Tax=Dentipellis fragilis TaxID=205917 RepID=A0A4Y9Z4Y3_9AGAM|nr:hypothetical protein EVG20_g3357 [Dentipellis fragilis]